MPQVRRYSSSAARQAAYRARCQQARAQQLKQKGLPALPAIPTMPGRPRWRAVVQSAQIALREACDQMADYYDERSETWQEGDPGQEFTERQEAFDELVSMLEDFSL